MSQTALQDFAKIAQQLAEALDRHKPTQGNQTLLVLADLSNELPEDNPLRQSIEQQMAKIAATDFNLDNQDLNKTLIVLGSLKGRLDSNDASQDKIDLLMAKVLSAKFDIVNGQVPGATTTPTPEPAQEEAPAPQPAEEKSQDKPAEESTTAQPEAASDAGPAGYSIAIPNQPATSTVVEPTPAESATPEAPEAETADPPASEEASPLTEFADQIHALQLNLDQLPVATKLAFDELKAIESKGGTIQGHLESLDQSGTEDEKKARLKSELDKLSALLNKIEDAPAEADQFQVLYDQVDPKHKDPKTGVFSIFQREYGGNARRFVVERTAQYAKYVPAEEARQRMIEDLHKLTEQAQKSLGQPAQPANGPGEKTANRAFFHG